MKLLLTDWGFLRVDLIFTFVCFGSGLSLVDMVIRCDALSLVFA